MVIHEEHIKSFIPKKEVQFVILGTMAAINARVIDEVKPEEEVFYYNNNRNHFWKVLQYLFKPNIEAKKNLTISEKKSLLELHGIAIINLVQKVEVPNIYKYDPSDTVLFEAFEKNRIEFKKLAPNMKKILKEKPIFFTCRHKKGIENLLNGFLQTNKIDPSVKDKIWYWANPTRCNPQARAAMWKQEMDEFIRTQF